MPESQTIANIITKWDRLVKIVINSDKVNRVEPNCFIGRAKDSEYFTVKTGSNMP